jgi:hypothetical protein
MKRVIFVYRNMKLTINIFVLKLFSDLGVSTAVVKLFEITSDIVTPVFQGSQLFTYFEGEWVSDVTNNYGLIFGFDKSSIKQLYDAVCSSVGWHLPECLSQEAHPLIGLHDLTSWAFDNGIDDSLGKLRGKIPTFHVRSGYTSSQTVDFYCARFGCGDETKIKLHELWELDMNPLTSESLASKFERVYAYNIWGDKDPGAGGGSGSGSSYDGTENIREYLPLLLETLKVKSVVDAGCGAMAWMPEALLSASAAIKATTCGDNMDISCISVGDMRYVGVDISSTAIARAETIASQYDHNGQWTFHRMDITTQALPGLFKEDLDPSESALESMRRHGLYDMVIARDIFFHLPFQRIKCALNQFSKMAAARKKYISSSEKVYLLTTTERLDLEEANGERSERSEVAIVDSADFLPMGSYRLQERIHTTTLWTLY